MRIAVIADIHANYEALKATFEDIEKRNVDRIICIGDIIGKGHHPKECIKLVKEKCDVVLIGNNDRYFTNLDNIDEISGIEKKRKLWNYNLTSDDEKEYLRKLPFSYEFYLSGSLVRLFHATPWADDKAILNTTPFRDKIKMFLPTDKTSSAIADVVVYGHIHQAFMDRFNNKTIINVGSVGNSWEVIRNEKYDSDDMEETRSQYLILEGEYGAREYEKPFSFEFVRVKYDIEKELADSDKNLEKEEYEEELRSGKYRNMKVIFDNFKKNNIDLYE